MRPTFQMKFIIILNKEMRIPEDWLGCLLKVIRQWFDADRLHLNMIWICNFFRKYIAEKLDIRDIPGVASNSSWGIKKGDPFEPPFSP